MKVEALHQQPCVVGHDAVLEEDHDQLAAHLMGITVGDVVRGEEYGVLDEVGQGAQDEGHEQVHVDVVASAVQPPERAQDAEGDQEHGQGGTVAYSVHDLEFQQVRMPSLIKGVVYVDPTGQVRPGEGF